MGVGVGVCVWVCGCVCVGVGVGVGVWEAMGVFRSLYLVCIPVSAFTAIENSLQAPFCPAL